MTQPLNIIFMGTPEFAVAGLRKLVESGHHVIAVVTVADKPSGRGLHLHQSPVKKYAEENNIKVLQPVKLKDPEFIEQLKSFHADLQVVVAFRMLPEIIWNMPKLGTINLHASLLPDYRGAAPVNWAIMNGEKETGVTTFFLKHEIDTGDMIMQEKIAIDENETSGTLHEKLMHLGADVLLRTVNAIQNGNYDALPQLNSSDKKAPKIFKEDCAIDWNKSTVEIRNFVRGLSPYPAAYTLLDGKLIKIFDVSIDEDETETVCGTYQSDNKTYLKYACKNGWIFISDMQLEGKKRMRVAEFLRGHQLKTT